MSTTHISFSLISRDTWMSTWTELVNWTVYLLEWSNFIGRRWVLSLGKSFSVFFPWQRHSRMCQIPERAGQYWAKRVNGCRTAGTDLGQIGDCSLTSLSSVFCRATGGQYVDFLTFSLARSRKKGTWFCSSSEEFTVRFISRYQRPVLVVFHSPRNSVPLTQLNEK